LRLGFLGVREAGWRFGFCVIGGVAASALMASSKDNGAKEIGFGFATEADVSDGFR
jgi:hypothetical protein